MKLSPDDRIAGVLAPLFAIRSESDLGIGDLGGLREFIDWAAGLGFKLVQMLPINESGRDNSPYNAISSVALDPLTLHLAPRSPNELTPEDYDAVVAEFDLVKMRRGKVNYRQVRKLKGALLEKAFARFETSPEFDQFCAEQKDWLEDYVLFRALMEKNRGRETWDQWPEEHRSLGKARAWIEGLSPKRKGRFGERQRFFRYVQWIAFGQWQAVRAYADARGVALMGDIPFGVSYYSADVFAQPEIFALDWSGGAPPEPYFKDDAFTQKWGQNWGIPLYRWDVMRSRNFAWWRRRIAGLKSIFHVFRIDHVLGFYRIYAFPWRPQRNEEFLPLSWDDMRARTDGREPHFAPRDDTNPESAAANCREGEEYLRMILEEAGATAVVGEDLGTVPDYVRPNLRSLGIAGFKIPQWEVYGGRVSPGIEYERISVTTYATHDHKPLRLMWEEAFEKESSTREQSRDALEKIATFANFPPMTQLPNYRREFLPAILRALFASNSWFALVMITDLLARKDRFNTPGRGGSGNWTRRLHVTTGQLTKSPAIKQQVRFVSELLRETGR